MTHFMQMQMHIIYLCKCTCAFFNFLCLTHLGVMYRCPYGVRMGLYLSVTYRSPQNAAIPYLPLLASCFSVLGSSELNGLSHPWVIACFLGLNSYIYISDEFTFPDHWSIPLNLVGSWPKP